MKDTALNTILIAGAFVALLVSAIAERHSAPQTATATVERVYSMDKTVIAARRMPAADAMAGLATDSRSTLVALAAP